VTALLPLVLLPMNGVAPAGTISSAYFSDAILLFLGTFILAAAVEKHGLHLRVYMDNVLLF
jgi:solute carrier family 13 (sodium-dependent dicarboxylate transporter), member 2/3/5